MKWNDYAELIGITAVVLSLLLVTYELRQNTLATQQAAAATYAENWRSIELFVAGDAEFASILRMSVDGRELAPTEQMRVNVFYRSVFRGWQHSYIQYRSGLLGDELWFAERTNILQILKGDAGMAPYWKNERSSYSESFIALIDELIDSE